MQAVQLGIMLAGILKFVPFRTTEFVSKIFPVYLPEVRPEWEMLIYRIMVMFSVALMAGWMWRFRKDMEERPLTEIFLPYLACLILLLFLQLFFVFKYLVWQQPKWALVMFYVTACVSLGGHIFWPELRKMMQDWVQRMPLAFLSKHGWIKDALAFALLLFLLWPANIQHVIARMFIFDQFYHIDSLILAPSYALSQGLRLNMDITSQYSVAIPALFSTVLQALGCFDYKGAVTMLITICLAYYFFLYLFIKLWLGSRTMAFFGMLLAVKLQMFHWGIMPLAWQFPSATALRHMPDLAVFVCLLLHSRHQKQQWLFYAAACVGYGMFWMVDVGVYLWLAMAVYVAMFQKRLLWIMALPFALAFLCLWAVAGAGVWTAEFWRNQFEFARLFVQGWGALPMTSGLKEQQFFAFVLGFAIPIVYIGHGLYFYFLRRQDHNEREAIWMVALTVYALGMYHYFIGRSGVTSYHVVSMPLVLMVCFWLSRLVERYTARIKYPGVFLGTGMLGALLTSYLFSFYPNVLNLGEVKWGQEAAFYQKYGTTRPESDMITALTKPDERVALVSSFEVKILMEAKRKPFFYYTPLVESALFEDSKVRLTYLHTRQRLASTLKQITDGKPRFIFMEKKLIEAQGQEGLLALRAAILKDYHPIQETQRLVAYKRNDG